MPACSRAWSVCLPGLNAFISPCLFLPGLAASVSVSVFMSLSPSLFLSPLRKGPKARVRLIRKMPGCNSVLHLWSRRLVCFCVQLVCPDTLLRDGKQTGIREAADDMNQSFGWSCFRLGSLLRHRPANLDSIVTFAKRTSDSEDGSSSNGSFFG